jgi:hypothetical protein
MKLNNGLTTVNVFLDPDDRVKAEIRGGYPEAEIKRPGGSFRLITSCAQDVDALRLLHTALGDVLAEYDSKAGAADA